MSEYLKIKDSLPVQRGNVVYENLDFLNALLYSIYQRARRWANNGVMERVFLALQREQIICIKIEHGSLDSTSVKVHPDAHGALKKEESKASESRAEDGTQKFMWLPRMIQ